MLHIAMHFIVPALVAVAFYRDRWRSVTWILIATMAVDLDHLLADPVYDPERCSIGFHPLHTAPAIGLYALMFALPALLGRTTGAHPGMRRFHLAGLGLVIHMALDGMDCLW